MDFKLISPYRPTGDQPEAIDELSRGILDGTPSSDSIGCNRVRKDIHYGECNRAGPEADSHFKPQQNSGRTII